MSAPALQIVAVDPVAVRKAAAFVEALAEVENRFGFHLRVGADGVAIDGAGDPFLVVAVPGDAHGLALGLEVASR